MKAYETNYWSLYFDYLKLFSNEAPHGYPIVLLSQFYEHIRKTPILQNELKDKPALDGMIHCIETEEEVQLLFGEYLPESMKKEGKGRIALHDHLLRFPPSVLKSFPVRETVIINNKSRHRKKNTGLPIISLQDSEHEIEHRIDHFKEKWYEIFKKYSRHPLMKYPAFKKRLIEELPRLLKASAAAEKVIKKEKPRVLLLGTTNTCESRALALTARKMDIPVICMQHGIIGLEFGYMPVLSHVQAVYGEYEYDWYLRKGIPSVNVRVTGHPRFDEITTKKYNPPLKLKLEPRKTTVLFIHHHEEVKVPREIITQLYAQSHLQLIIKSRGSPKEIRKLQGAFPGIRIASGIHLYDLIKAADVVVSYPSTVVLESLLADRPVFIWSIPGEDPPLYFKAFENCIYSSPSRLVKQLLNHVNKNKLKELLINEKDFLSYHYPLAGEERTSTDELLHIIKNMNG
ncbi:hypothetical protein [Halobacillus sp. A5]|uniref:hypothetical protein n=1 Tax=Halobacillus sp. A5 TaxID=2880263 RepID=UPI0020A65242|nr:hypothetical protein [Halobacillus sp. A5]MCP3028407.1 hypothetical protein [Halobacillus sp. A5]